MKNLTVLSTSSVHVYVFSVPKPWVLAFRQILSNLYRTRRKRWRMKTTQKRYRVAKIKPIKIVCSPSTNQVPTYIRSQLKEKNCPHRPCGKLRDSLYPSPITGNVIKRAYYSSVIGFLVKIDVHYCGSSIFYCTSVIIIYCVL